MTDSPSSPPRDPAEEPTPAAERSSRRKAPLVAGGVLALVAAGVVAAVLVLGGDDDESGSPGDDPSDQDERGSSDDADDQRSGSSRSDDEVGSSPTRADDPEAVVRAYLDAFADEDCEAMAGFVTPESLESEGLGPEEALRTCEEGFEADQAESFDIQNVELVDEEDDTGVVEVSASIEGETESTRFTLRRVDEEWLIDLTATDAAEGSDAGDRDDT